MSANDGGPAFPTTSEPFHQGFSGMTLRDWFAGQALAVWVQAHIDQSVDDLSKADIASQCYHYADFMLAERNRRQP